MYPLGPTTRLRRGHPAPGQRSGSPSRPTSPPRGGRASPAPANREDVGGPRTPPSPKNDLGREVTCAPGPRCGCSQRGRGGEEKGRLLPRRGRVCRSLLHGAPDAMAGVSGTPAPFSAAPSPPPPTCDHSGPPLGRCARLPRCPQPTPAVSPATPRPARLSAASPRASGCPAPGAGHPPPARAEPSGEAPPPARGPGAWGSGGAKAGLLQRVQVRRRADPYLRPAPPQRRPPGPRPDPRVPAGGAWGQSPEPSERVAGGGRRRRKYWKPGPLRVS